MDKTIAEVAAAYGVHRTTINKAIKRNAFPSRRMGTLYVINDDEPAFLAWAARSGMGRPRKNAQPHEFSTDVEIAIKKA